MKYVLVVTGPHKNAGRISPAVWVPRVYQAGQVKFTRGDKITSKRLLAKPGEHPKLTWDSWMVGSSLLAAGPGPDRVGPSWW